MWCLCLFVKLEYVFGNYRKCGECESAEWQNEDNLDINEMIIPEKVGTGSRMSVYTITEHFFLSMGKCMKLSKYFGEGKLGLRRYYFRLQQIRIAGTSVGIQTAQSGSSNYEKSAN